LMNFIGEPYAGKLHVRFDEGAEKGLSLLALLYCAPWLIIRVFPVSSVYPVVKSKKYNLLS
jgi:hypothetical protein